MATTATIKKNIAKLEAALKSKATPKSLKPKLETQLVKSKAELSGMNKGTKPKTSSTKSTQTALQKLKAMVNKNKKYKTYKGAGVDLEKDADRPALRTGRRIAKESGKTYYEYRANRIDVKQPPKKYPKLEKGGVSDEVYTKGYQKFRTELTEFSINYKENGKMKEAKIKSHFKGDAVEEFRKKHPNAELVGVYEKVRFSKMAKGGMSQDEESILVYYVNHYPEDELALEIKAKATFNGLYEVLSNKGDAYEYIGVADSIVRERVFEKLAKIKGVKYDVIYDMWMDSDYAKGGELTPKDKLIKELQKLQTQLNSSRLSQYREGDNSEEEMARQRERESKLDRFNEILEVLKEDDKMAKGGISQKEVAESNAEMVLSQIKAVKHHAQELSNVVSKNSDIEAWVVAKIERASTDLSDITHYLEFQTKKMAMGGEIHRTQD
jgi:hypothetical protein